MKSKFLVTLAILASSLSTFSASAAWYTAEVIFVGKGPTGTFMRLSDRSASNSTGVTFQRRLFKLADNVSLEGLAIGMAGATSNKLLVIESNVDSLTEGELATIREVYLSTLPSK